LCNGGKNTKLIGKSHAVHLIMTNTEKKAINNNYKETFKDFIF